MAIPRFIHWRIQNTKRFLKRVTPLTWFIWAATVSDLCAPGYLTFHLLVTELDMSEIATEVVTVWEVATDASED